MPALPNHVLFAKLRSALPLSTRFETPKDALRPAIAVIPGFGRARFYVWTVTADRSAPGARPRGEFKIQLIVDGQARSARGALHTAKAYTTLLGFSPDFGVFAAWEPRIYTSFAYSANVQVRDSLLAEARDVGWAVAPPRTLRGTSEVRVAFAPGNLMHFLRVSREADKRRLMNSWREAFFLAKTPNYPPTAMPRRAAQLESFIETERRRVAATRLTREATFGPLIKEQFDYACALCRTQLEIVEAAHIIPVHEAGSSDELWNGLALCPTHHRLFDARRFVIRGDLVVRVDFDALRFLRDSGRSTGEELLTAFHDRPIMAPRFWETEREIRDRMCRALVQVATLAAVA